MALGVTWVFPRRGSDGGNQSEALSFPAEREIKRRSLPEADCPGCSFSSAAEGSQRFGAEQPFGRVAVERRPDRKLRPAGPAQAFDVAEGFIRTPLHQRQAPANAGG